eukprot:Nk52_evm15s2506 gene=Nk52_evmTU15s2506
MSENKPLLPQKEVFLKTEATLQKLEALSEAVNSSLKFLNNLASDLEEVKTSVKDIRGDKVQSDSRETKSEGNSGVSLGSVGKKKSRRRSIAMNDQRLSTTLSMNDPDEDTLNEAVSDLLHSKALSHLQLHSQFDHSDKQPLDINDEEFEEIQVELEEAINNLESRGEFDVITPLNPKDAEIHPEDKRLYRKGHMTLFEEELEDMEEGELRQKEVNVDSVEKEESDQIEESKDKGKAGEGDPTVVKDSILNIDMKKKSTLAPPSAPVVKRQSFLKYITNSARRGTSLLPHFGKKANPDDTWKEKFRQWCILEESSHTIKIFGDKLSVEMEKKRHIEYMKESGHLIIHPYSSFRYHWDIIMMLLLMVTLIILPVALAFDTGNIIEGDIDFFVVFDFLSDLVFLFDIFLNFRTGSVEEDDEIALDKKTIRLDYLQGWFFVDLLSSFPLDLVVEGIAAMTGNAGDFSALGATRLFRLLRLFKLLRVLRISRLFRYLHRWQEIMVTVGENYLRIVKLIFVMILFAHWSGCIQLMVARLMDFPPESWVTIAGIQHSSQFVQYSWALFKALSHMLSIGYGREKPQSDAEVWLIICSMLVGTAFYAIFIGNVSSILLSIDSAGRLFRERMQQVNEYLRYAKIPHPLRVRVRDYYDFKYSHKKLFDEHVILGDMSQSMREEVQLYNCRDLVKKVPFFNDIEPVIVSALVCQMEPKHYLPGDIVISEGSFGSEMFFIRTGLVEIITKGNLLTTIGDGSYFGEIALLRDHRYRRMATVQAATHLVLYQLTREHFQTIVSDYPIIKKEMQLIAYARLARVAQTMGTEAPNPGTLSGHGGGSSNGNLEQNQASRNEAKGGGGFVGFNEEHDHHGKGPDESIFKAALGPRRTGNSVVSVDHTSPHTAPPVEHVSEPIETIDIPLEEENVEEMEDDTGSLAHSMNRSGDLPGSITEGKGD